MNSVKVAGKECTHCWHQTGRATLKHPPVFEELCCWCGACKYPLPQVKPVAGEHGPFLSRINKEVAGLPK